MLAVVPFNWQVHDTHFVVAHLHYVLIGGYVFPMVAAIYYFMPLLTGRTRFFKLGEAAFWLVVPSFHITFLSIHMAGLLGQRRRTWTYDADQGWTALNLVASIASFVMAIGFALIILDVAVNAFVAVRGRRNPWGAGTLEWAAAIPSPAYGFASIPIVEGRYPLHDEPDLALHIARGEGYLGDSSRNRRETLIVSTARGEPSQVVVLPGNSVLPFLLAVVTSTSFLAPLFDAYIVAGLALVGVVALALVWAWGLGARADEGPVDAGHGAKLPLASESPDPPGWWGIGVPVACGRRAFRITAVWLRVPVDRCSELASTLLSSATAMGRHPCADGCVGADRGTAPCGACDCEGRRCVAHDHPWNCRCLGTGHRCGERDTGSARPLPAMPMMPRCGY